MIIKLKNQNKLDKPFKNREIWNILNGCTKCFDTLLPHSPVVYVYVYILLTGC